MAMILSFEPWVGVNFGSRSRLGQAVLILGESHYDEGFGQGARLTEFVIRRHIEREGKQYAFWTKIARTLTGPTYSDKADRVSFWESVGFYNYVQEFVGTGPRQRPTEGHYRDSLPQFLSVIDRLRPDLVLTLGFGLWDSLRPLLPSPGPVDAPKYQSRACEASWLERAGHRTLIGYVKHPSTGYSPAFWHEWYCAYSRALDANPAI